MSEPLTREQIAKMREKGIVFNIYDLLDSHEVLRAQLAAVTKEWDEVRSQQAHTASCVIHLQRKLDEAKGIYPEGYVGVCSNLAAAQAEVEHLQNLIPDHIRSAIAAHGDSLGEMIIKLTGDYSLVKAEVVRLKGQLDKIGVNDKVHYRTWREEAERLSDEMVAQRTHLESRTARLLEDMSAMLNADYETRKEIWNRNQQALAGGS